MKKALKVLEYIKKKSREDSLEIRLCYSEMAYYNGKPESSGYFDYPEDNKNIKTPIIVVGIDKEESKWVEVLLHEFNHYLQWKNKTKLWKKYRKAIENFEEGSKELTEATVQMESECEQNTITLAKKIGYDINESVYIKKVNAYLVFYQIAMNEDKWYKKPPFENDKILRLVPGDKVIRDPMNYKITKNLEKLFKDCL